MASLLTMGTFFLFAFVLMMFGEEAIAAPATPPPSDGHYGTHRQDRYHAGRLSLPDPVSKLGIIPHQPLDTAFKALAPQLDRRFDSIQNPRAMTPTRWNGI